jgi:uncharacterized protein (DUF1697 family)
VLSTAQLCEVPAPPQREDDAMTTFAVLLRGINVGGAARLPMADLRTELGTAGFDDVRTYIASGNVMLESDLDPDRLAATVRGLLLERFELDRPVVVRTAQQLEQVVARNPLTDRTDDQTKLHVVFIDGADGAPDLQLDAAAFLPEEFALDDGAVYLYLPDGMARSPLAVALERNAPAPVATSRNWRTVLKLAEMCRNDR